MQNMFNSLPNYLQRWMNNSNLSVIYIAYSHLEKKIVVRLL